jgi:hypothetical protein
MLAAVLALLTGLLSACGSTTSSSATTRFSPIEEQYAVGCQGPNVREYCGKN